MADRHALITILGEEAPRDWPARLETLQKTPEYDAVIEVYEPTALRLEQGAELDEVISLLGRLGGGKLPN
jgi:hypothetical protein